MEANILICPKTCIHAKFIAKRFSNPRIHAVYENDKYEIHLWKDSHTSLSMIINSINFEYLCSIIAKVINFNTAWLFDKLYFKKALNDRKLANFLLDSYYNIRRF